LPCQGPGCPALFVIAASDRARFLRVLNIANLPAR
jgi:hypothetical protein